MPAIHQTVHCPLPGLEEVEVTYNLMASGAQIEQFTQSLGETETAGVIISVKNWPESMGQPFGEDAPIAFRVWAVQRGLQDSIRAFVADPN